MVSLQTYFLRRYGEVFHNVAIKGFMVNGKNE